MSEVKLYLGDCLEIMKSIPDKSVDAVITDPPYGVDVADKSKGGEGGRRAKRRIECFDDGLDYLTMLIDWFLPESKRIAKVVGICAGIKTMMSYPQPDWALAWIYQNKTNFCPYGFNNWTPILCYGKDPYQQSRNGNAPLAVKNDVIFCDVRAERNGHPTPKPIAFMRELILRFSVSECDTILDPFMGSGTTGVACVQTGRNFIGIEIDEKYFKIAEKRIKDAQQQMRLPI